MFKDILVPTDLSERTDHALKIAAQMAGRNHSRVHLLHVIETLEDVEFDELKDFYLKLERRAVNAMEKMSAVYREAEIVVESHISYGKRAPGILKYVEENRVDLIVMNSHKIDLEHPSGGWGTISYKVGILAACPVMLVK